jgi:hypothetical protein
MKKVASMVAVSVAAWLVVAMLVDARTRVEVLYGMLGPLAVVCGTWLLTEHTYRTNPGSLTSMMIAAFGFKVLFFGGYVAVMLGLLAVRPMPFVVSFTSYFIGLYLMEALYMRQMFS